MKKGKQNTMFSKANTLDIAGDVDLRPKEYFSLCVREPGGCRVPVHGGKCSIYVLENHSAKATFQKFNELPD